MKGYSTLRKTGGCVPPDFIPIQTDAPKRMAILSLNVGFHFEMHSLPSVNMRNSLQLFIPDGGINVRFASAKSIGFMRYSFDWLFPVILAMQSTPNRMTRITKKTNATTPNNA